jgi:hypothetical protein
MNQSGNKNPWITTTGFCGSYGEPPRIERIERIGGILLHTLYANESFAIVHFQDKYAVKTRQRNSFQCFFLIRQLCEGLPRFKNENCLCNFSKHEENPILVKTGHTLSIVSCLPSPGTKSSCYFQYRKRRSVTIQACMLMSTHLNQQVLEILELVIRVGLLDVSSDLESTINENSDLLEVLLHQATAATKSQVSINKQWKNRRTQTPDTSRTAVRCRKSSTNRLSIRIKKLQTLSWLAIQRADRGAAEHSCHQGQCSCCSEGWPIPIHARLLLRRFL